MTEVPIEVGYRSYIRLLRKKWDIIYHSKDLYFSHANKILEPHYDMHTKEFYGIETNPTRLAIIKFIDQFREGPGIFETEKFRHDLLENSLVYTKRVKLRKPFRAGRHQQSHPSLTDSYREEWYQYQSKKPKVKMVLPKSHPYQNTLIVEDHPYEKMVGRSWTHIYVPTPVDFEVLDSSTQNCYKEWLQQACSESHDIIILEPVQTRFNAALVLRLFWWSKMAIKLAYALSIMHSCHQPQRWKRGLFLFLGVSMAHLGVAGCLFSNPLAKYKLPDLFHDTEALNELKYFRDFVPTLVHKVLVLYKDTEGQIAQPLWTINTLHLTNLFVLGYNYLFGIDHWFSFPAE